MMRPPLAGWLIALALLGSVSANVVAWVTLAATIRHFNREVGAVVARADSAGRCWGPQVLPRR